MYIETVIDHPAVNIPPIDTDIQVIPLETEDKIISLLVQKICSESHMRLMWTNQVVLVQSYVCFSVKFSLPVSMNSVRCREITKREKFILKNT